MKKLFARLDKDLLLVGLGLFLLFVPLYPKLPLIDVAHTWTYIRLEDIFVTALVAILFFRLRRNKNLVSSPLTPLVVFYWFAGGASLVFALVFLRQNMANFFPNVAVFHFLRRIEYLSLFFVGLAAVRQKNTLKPVLLFLGLATLGVTFYGFGQKLFAWPAYLTMNEEFAKGIPLRLPSTARIPSTFAGHYDLAGWLVVILGLWASMFFAFRGKFLKLASFLLFGFAYLLLLFTASRVSFAAYLVAICTVLWLHKKRWLIVPVVVASLVTMSLVSGASERFLKTLRVEKVIYNAKTGQPVGTLEEGSDIGKVFTEEDEVAKDSLPLGSGFISLPVKREPEATQVAVIKKPIITALKTASESSQIATISGEFLIRRALVYDISFTTRFQGTWPRALAALKRNFIFGSGYSSINLATDNSFLRSLGETGLLGFAAFFSIFVGFFLLLRKNLQKITDPLIRGFVIAVGAGLAGLLLNAVLIDIFEASKVAFLLWPLLGLGVGLMAQKKSSLKPLNSEGGKVISTPLFQIVILAIVGLVVFLPTFRNYFVGDDFTWLKWAAQSDTASLKGYFLEADGFFYRPLAKVYFFFAQTFFNLQPNLYHLIDSVFHLGVTAGLYLLALSLTKNKWLSFGGALLFLLNPLNAEPVLWISSTSILLANLFIVWGLVFYRWWRFSTSRFAGFFLAVSFLAFLGAISSHELGVVLPALLVLHDLLFVKSTSFCRKYLVLLPFIFALFGYSHLRNSVAGAHGLSGDYNYNFHNLVFNFPGNLFGYLGELFGGPRFLKIYDWLRTSGREHKKVVFGAIGLFGILAAWLLRKKRPNRESVFFFGMILILLSPFLGLGNIAQRYFYLAKAGVIFLALLLVVSARVYRFRIGKALFLGLLLVSVVASYIRLESAKREWFEAGETSNRVLLSLGTNLADFPPESRLYFANLPMRIGQAWVFPVGLEDGLWFIYRDETLVVDQINDWEGTLKATEGQPNVYIFLYENGELKQVKMLEKAL